MIETTDAIRAYLIGLIEAKGRLPAGIDVDGFNYIDSGHVDSIGIIKFVLGIESRYGIEIGEEDMMSTGFRTVGGLVAMIAGKLGQKAG